LAKGPKRRLLKFWFQIPVKIGKLFLILFQGPGLAKGKRLLVHLKGQFKVRKLNFLERELRFQGIGNFGGPKIWGHL